MIRVHRVGQWGAAAAILQTAPLRIRRALDAAVMQEAQFFRRKVVEGIREQAPGGQRFRPLSETTLALRRFRGFGGTKALVVRGDLRNSVTVVKRQTPLGAEAFVGVLRNARGRRSGQSLFNVAQVHEFGSRTYAVAVTPAMRRFLAVAFKQELGGLTGGSGGLSRGVIVIRIPARPFIKPVADAYFTGPVAALRFQRRVATGLGGTFGAAAGLSR